MIFEVPVDHFPVQRTMRPLRPPALLLTQISALQGSQEVSEAVVLSPSVRRSQFTFGSLPLHLSTGASMGRAVSMPSLARRTPTPVSPAQSMLKLLSLPLRFLSTAVSLPHIA
ncbi:unnamed protein product [Heligmosomoides polygyrus]|uniref:Uncharacterized protein n=1 Tax=Heligmosomoides polygyrus TaxID=6339 RepID=A0A183FGK6_HELPZ|nr:unnamed protein product [Heligmosomoides polygyrus]